MFLQDTLGPRDKTRSYGNEIIFSLNFSTIEMQLVIIPTFMQQTVWFLEVNHQFFFLLRVNFNV